jgi:hypothetical protein
LPGNATEHCNAAAVGVLEKMSNTATQSRLQRDYF